jgi:16S rRNA (guanine527-N7)-methyltransferase
LDQHVADSLSGLEAPALRSAFRIADIGAGAGFPGLPLAIALPAAQIDLIESTSRKCDVIARLAAAADISNARAISTRAEQHAAESPASYDVVTARALAALPILLEYAAPLLKPSGTLVAWKTMLDSAELAAAAKAAQTLGMKPREVIPVKPFESAHSRTLYVYEKTAPTPSRFPRRPGMALKRPLA